MKKASLALLMAVASLSRLLSLNAQAFISRQGDKPWSVITRSPNIAMHAS